MSKSEILKHLQGDLNPLGSIDLTEAELADVVGGAAPFKGPVMSKKTRQPECFRTRSWECKPPMGVIKK